ncbi:hypothetical protein ACKI14_45185 [Streptomyces turgidiscabies]|uniref:hypothetical protein n=1 Tax=Streptomyces turgidiscabies TaxID=85558 RepID=UPI0038F766CC
MPKYTAGHSTRPGNGRPGLASTPAVPITHQTPAPPGAAAAEGNPPHHLHEEHPAMSQPEFNRDEWNERAIPTVPGQRRPEPAEEWNPDAARRVPRQPGSGDTNH